MISAMFQALPEIGSSTRAAWVDYFDSFQRPEDGLFYDDAVACSGYRDSDWWGARHLALHLVNAYADLGARPRHPFRFLEEYYPGSGGIAPLVRWLDEVDDVGGDGDNKIMNIGCLLQYQRDHWGDDAAGCAVEDLKRALLARVNNMTGMWRPFDVRDMAELSRLIQVAYHIFPLFFYDGHRNFRREQITRAVLRLQNRVGGFGARLNSSACEDIDAIDILLAFASGEESSTEEDHVLRDAIGRSLRWVLANQMEDGGFVFRLHEPFVYGHPEMSSRANEGALFPTWFRVLSIGSMVRFLGGNLDLVLGDCPGYTAMCYRGEAGF
jgi:hypothetical protein